VSFDRAGKFLLVANYSIDTEPPGSSPDQAIAVTPIRSDGAVGAPVASRAHLGSGPGHAASSGASRPLPHRAWGLTA
jgi:6-phosphogluconolactonase (cycloisomerase 2 family)